MTVDPKIVIFPKKREKATVEIQPYPEDVIDVDPQILAIMKARLAGESFDCLYSRDDQLTNDIAIERERQKLKAMFCDSADVYKGFSSLESLRVTRANLKAKAVDRETLARYARVKCAGQAVDEVDVYAHLVSGSELFPKQVRYDSMRKLSPTLGKLAQELVQEVSDHYLADDFGPFGVSREIVKLEGKLAAQVNSGEIQRSMDEVLNVLYGRIG